MTRDYRIHNLARPAGAWRVRVTWHRPDGGPFGIVGTRLFVVATGDDVSLAVLAVMDAVPADADIREITLTPAPV